MILLAFSCMAVAPATPPAQPPQVSSRPQGPAGQPISRPPPRIPEEGAFQLVLAEGLRLAGYMPPEIEDIGYRRTDPGALAGTDARIFVVTVDVSRYELLYLSTLDASLTGAEHMPAHSWAERFDLQVAFNPGMFEPDGRATGHTRSGSFVSQPLVRRNGLYRSWFVADPLDPGAGLPGAATIDQIPPKGDGLYGGIDALPAPFREKIAGYQIVSQSLSILRGGAPVYPARNSQWSELAYGTDGGGNVVIVFSRYPYEMREFGARVAALGLGIEGLLHGEGGPEASLVVQAGGVSLSLCGSYETGFADDSNEVLWSLPAVMGVKAR